jgi:hypothetical protein
MQNNKEAPECHTMMEQHVDPASKANQIEEKAQLY